MSLSLSAARMPSQAGRRMLATEKGPQKGYIRLADEVIFDLVMITLFLIFG